MESNCCGASEWMEETGICSDCKEHCEFIDEEEENRWVLLEEGYPHTVLLTENEAQAMKQKWQMIHRNLQYKVIFDEYHEYTEY